MISRLIQNLVLMLFLATATLAQEPLFDVKDLSGRQDLATVRGAVAAARPAIAISVPSLDGKQISLALDSKGPGPEYYWSLYTFVNTSEAPQSVVFALQESHFTGSSQLGFSTAQNATFGIVVTGVARAMALEPASNLSFSIAPKESISVAVEHGVRPVEATLWSAAAFQQKQIAESYFRGAILAIGGLFTFAALYLFAIRGRRVFLAGAAFSAAAMLFLAQDMFGLGTSLARAVSTTSQLQVSTAIEFLMLAALAWLLSEFSNARQKNAVLWMSLLTVSLLAVCMIGLIHLVNVPGGLIARIGFLAVAALGLPSLLKARAKEHHAFDGVVFVWCTVVAWTAFALVATFVMGQDRVLAPILWSSLVAVLVLLGLSLLRHGLAESPSQAVLQGANNLALALRGGRQHIWDWNAAENQLNISETFAPALNYNQVASFNAPGLFSDLIHPDDKQQYQLALQQIVAQAAQSVDVLIRLREAGGTYYQHLLRAQVVQYVDGGPGHCVGTLTEVPELQTIVQQVAVAPSAPAIPTPSIIEPAVVSPTAVSNANEVASAVEKLADTVSGLPDRNQFLARFDLALAQPMRAPYRIMLVGIDRFRMINDGLGHAGGDQVLQQVAKRITANLSAQDLACRMSGSLFAVYCAENAAMDRAQELARAITINLAAAIDVQDHDVLLSASIGISEIDREGIDVEEMFAEATSALQAARNSGTGKTVFFELGMRDDRPLELALEQDLRRAITRSEIEVHFQPITRLDSFELAGFEALARWHHPLHGNVRPDQFIAAAETAGLIAEIGHQVLAEAVRQLGIWQRTLARNRQMFVAVNVSASQIMERDFVASLKRILAREQIVPGSLKLEITESVIMQFPDRMKDLFLQLRAMGISLACDDFGTGFSSLSLLRELPFDTLKIDKSFISSAGLDERARHVVETVLDLAHGLGMAVVAEGIESEDMADALARLGCDFGQGYYFGMAAPAKEVEDLLAVLPQALRNLEADVQRKADTLSYKDIDISRDNFEDIDAVSLPSIYSITDARPKPARKKKKVVKTAKKKTRRR